jgi:magnesium transporter
MLTALWYKRGALRFNIDPDEIDELLPDRDGLLWVDLERPTYEELEILDREFRFHHLAMEDISKKNQRPKLDRYNGYVYLVLYRLTADEIGSVQPTEVDLVVGANYVVSVHDEPIPAITALRWRCQEQPSILDPHPLGFLIYRISDGLVDEYFPLVDALEARLEDVEERALRSEGDDVLADIFSLRKDLVRLRNTIDPSRDVFNVLARREESFLDPTTIVYFTDVYDHLLRISSRIDGLRDLTAVALETHLSVQSNRLNLTVERLTALTLVLMVVTLITGFCGMNVEFPGRDDPMGLVYAIVFMSLIGLSAVVFSRLRGWL